MAKSEIEFSSNQREKLSKLLCTAHSISTEAACFEDATYARQLKMEADYLIANGVTIPVRCKDCKHSVWDEENEMWKCVESADYDEDSGEWFGFYEYHNDDFFCADGERKDNG